MFSENVRITDYMMLFVRTTKVVIVGEKRRARFSWISQTDMCTQLTLRKNAGERTRE